MLEEDAYVPTLNGTVHEDYLRAKKFLLSYQGSQDTYNAYRREVERFIQWCQLIEKKSLSKIDRESFEKYLHFCSKPPKAWIGLQQVPRFLKKSGERVPNQKWRPFVATISKIKTKQGQAPSKSEYQLSEKGFTVLFAVLSSFYTYLIQENYTDVNPVLLIRQKSQFFKKSISSRKIRRLSELQWAYVIETAEIMADQTPEVYERSLFILNALYGMYLRISELAATPRWSPTMGDFRRDHNNNWWFNTVGKGNKAREISVSDAMLAALKRYRKFLTLPSLPTIDESTPLVCKTHSKGPVKTMRFIRMLVQEIFDKAIDRLKNDNQYDEAEQLAAATVHWLRHTGISDDVKTRPREHVRDDAGHSSSAITDKYIDIQMRDRHASGKKKRIKPELLNEE
jgi:site-specific recombinase XerD